MNVILTILNEEAKYPFFYFVVKQPLISALYLSIIAISLT